MILEFDQNKSKVRQLSDAIRTAISSGEFKEGDTLPSINKISAKYNLARDTVYKAFQDLKEKGIIESAPTRGYFVSNTVNNIFVLLDIFGPYKENFYKELTANLPLNYRLDLYFHHYNKRSFNNIIQDSVGRYDLYLITNLQNDVYSEVLDRLDNTKVLLVDLGKFKKDKFSYVCQGFDTTLYDCLTSGLDKFSKYKEICLVFNAKSEHPKSCIPYFEQFCMDNNFAYNIITRDLNSFDIVPGTAYIAVRHIDMIQIVKTCRLQNYELGRDVGLVTMNDAPMLEVIENGISVISTNFKQMGKIAAEYIKTRQKVQVYIPTQLILRGSL
ncbi:MAG: GntR family transcriptional regulator [Dysgonomonas sp.]|jgi:DNA-binding transcriptional regulator YhcF (GntR family)|uniref:GntR family transcriptional regulator n=1 Tax=unclassified Dysgonomonas TaxID=2630389 RepID=UPI0025B948E0|nr:MULTISPECIES: GntR family transcriptional regulator [unclassified Dysgonomonas]MDR1716785.1 GntR family transcriptional regulator [Prevotella sp.]MDR2004779.1 GntR family transcriptional regulator [Prevotella sp.]HMM01396.1 GntR family transcriptional regulator [Dysgonomonas sp.]